MKECSVLVKPVSSLCNMRCRYCFYADVSRHREAPVLGRMDAATAEALLARLAEGMADTGVKNAAQSRPGIFGADKKGKRTGPGVPEETGRADRSEAGAERPEEAAWEERPKAAGRLEASETADGREKSEKSGAAERAEKAGGARCEAASAESARAESVKAAEKRPFAALSIAFQGGEPTLAGLSFYKDFVSRARAVLPKACRISFSIQTNGLLLDDAFCSFLAEEKFLVGLSLDGYAEIHDALRPDFAGKGTFSRVLAAASRLRRHGVQTNLLTVVSGPLARHARRLWHFYQKNQFDFVQLIPCLPPLEKEAERSPHALTPRAYGAFLKELFPLWTEGLLRGRYISVRLFDNLVRQAAGRSPEMCGMRGVCSPQFVVEADGSVYPCDFYVLDELRLGNIRENSLDALISHPVCRAFLAPVLPAPCRDCPVFSLCRGGCRRSRSLFHAEEGYCPYRDFLLSCREELSAASAFVFGKGPSAARL